MLQAFLAVHGFNHYLHILPQWGWCCYSLRRDIERHLFQISNTGGLTSGPSTATKKKTFFFFFLIYSICS
ncbi:hypothetical protein FKM82_013251 [Ascaphus truei]